MSVLARDGVWLARHLNAPRRLATTLVVAELDKNNSASTRKAVQTFIYYCLTF